MLYTGGSTFVCEGDHPHLLKKKKKKLYTQKKIYISNYFKLIYSLITLTWKQCMYIYIYTHLKKILYVKLTDFNYLNKNV